MKLPNGVQSQHGLWSPPPVPRGRVRERVCVFSLVKAKTLSPALPRSTGGGSGPFGVFAFILAIAHLAGCAAPPKPARQYDALDAAASLSVLRDRTARLHTVRGQADVLLTDDRGQTVRLDGVYLLAPPGQARVRAWKLGTAVFDLTLDGERAYAYVPRNEAKPAAPGLRQSVGQWLALLGGRGRLFDGPAVIDGDDLVVRQPTPGGSLECRIDRRTLTPRLYRAVANGTPAFELTLTDYQDAGNGQVWPRVIRATQLAGGRRVVEIRTHDVDVNTPLPTDAFQPPVRAEALP